MENQKFEFGEKPADPNANKCPSCGDTMLGSNQGMTLICPSCQYQIGIDSPKEGDRPNPENLDTITT